MYLIGKSPFIKSIKVLMTNSMDSLFTMNSLKNLNAMYTIECMTIENPIEILLIDSIECLKVVDASHGQ